jgi:hypothetical protein
MDITADHSLTKDYIGKKAKKKKKIKKKKKKKKNKKKKHVSQNCWKPDCN